MKISDAERLMPESRVLCPADLTGPERFCLVVEVGKTPHQDLFGDPFLWVTVRDLQKGVIAVFPSNLITRAPLSVSSDEGQGELFGDRSPVI